jgi:hypothetical protein
VLESNPLWHGARAIRPRRSRSGSRPGRGVREPLERPGHRRASCVRPEPCRPLVRGGHRRHGPRAAARPSSACAPTGPPLRCCACGGAIATAGRGAGRATDGAFGLGVSRSPEAGRDPAPPAMPGHTYNLPALPDHGRAARALLADAGRADGQGAGPLKVLVRSWRGPSRRRRSSRSWGSWARGRDRVVAIPEVCVSGRDCDVWLCTWFCRLPRPARRLPRPDRRSGRPAAQDPEAMPSLSGPAPAATATSGCASTAQLRPPPRRGRRGDDGARRLLARHDPGAGRGSHGRLGERAPPRFGSTRRSSSGCETRREAARVVASSA